MPLLNETEITELKKHKLYKITNKEEIHNGFQYHDGLNTDIIEFNPTGSCEPGGLYFSEVKDIFNFLGYGIWIREVIIPENKAVYQDPQGNKYKCHSLILGKRKKLFTKTMFKKLIKEGANIHAENDFALRWASENGHIETTKLLLEHGANIHACDDEALRWASCNGHIETAKLLLEHGADVHVDNDYALIYASRYGHTEIVKLLLERGADIHACADIHADDDYALRCASNNGHTETVKLLLEHGADIHACDDYALRNASYNGHIEVVKLLLEAGADIHANNDYALRFASCNGHAETVKLLNNWIKEHERNGVKI